MKQIKGLVALKISPLELNKKRIDENRIRAYTLFSSSAKSWEMSGNIMLNPKFITPPTSETEKSSIPLAYLLQGEFPSYFAGKSIPEKKSENTDSKTTDRKDSEKPKPGKEPPIDLSKIKGGESVLAKGKPSKIFLIGSSEMLKDSLLDPEGKGPNAVFIMNILDVMNHRENIASMRSKEQLFNPLYESAGYVKTFTKTFNVAGLPVLVVLFGLFVWLRRHSRKKQIQMIFQKSR